MRFFGNNTGTYITIGLAATLFAVSGFLLGKSLYEAESVDPSVSVEETNKSSAEWFDTPASEDANLEVTWHEECFLQRCVPNPTWLNILGKIEVKSHNDTPVYLLRFVLNGRENQKGCDITYEVARELKRGDEALLYAWVGGNTFKDVLGLVPFIPPGTPPEVAEKFTVEKGPDGKLQNCGTVVSRVDVYFTETPNSMYPTRRQSFSFSEE